MNILITNDDGIRADGIIRLARAAQAFGEVWVVAPDGQRSAASHGISLHNPIDVYPQAFPADGVRAFSCTGTPADCVRVGALYIMPEKPDIVLSGINFGYNTATDIQYSGTAGAAFEGTFQGCKAIAFSEGASGCHAVTDHFLPDILRELLSQELSYGQIFNVNFPDCALSECKGILRNRTVSRGMFFRDSYRMTAQLSADGVRLAVDGAYNKDAEPGTDFRAVVDGYISIGIVNNVG